jgi:hypothetical protein
MKQLRIFISSVQKEFAEERHALAVFINGDPLLRRFFYPVLFEDLPASGKGAERVYLDEVKECDIYLGLFGLQYGNENASGLSPTHVEFDLASRLAKTRLIYIKGNDSGRHPKMAKLVKSVDKELVRRRFESQPELIYAVKT